MSTDGLTDWASGQGVHARRRTRLLMLLDAADYAVISPLPTARLHAFAFLADVLSPIYEFAALTGRVMKRRVGPYFPDLQWELDRLVGMGLADISGLKPVVEVSTAYLDASFSLNRDRAAVLLSLVYEDAGFGVLRDFFRELADALGAVPDDDLDSTTQADVTWESGHAGTVIDYAEWRARNYSKLTADRIDEIAREKFGDSAGRLSPGAKVNLYVRYLRRVSNA